jgi:hypothetical protein
MCARSRTVMRFHSFIDEFTAFLQGLVFDSHIHVRFLRNGHDLRLEAPLLQAKA